MPLLLRFDRKELLTSIQAKRDGVLREVTNILQVGVGVAVLGKGYLRIQGRAAVCSGPEAMPCCPIG